jgi:hypothetical protein
MKELRKKRRARAATLRVLPSTHMHPLPCSASSSKVLALSRAGRLRGKGLPWCRCGPPRPSSHRAVLHGQQKELPSRIVSCAWAVTVREGAYENA